MLKKKALDGGILDKAKLSVGRQIKQMLIDCDVTVQFVDTNPEPPAENWFKVSGN